MIEEIRLSLMRIARACAQQMRSFTERPFVRSVTAMFAGTLATQVANVATSPILTRIFSPESFGLLGLFNFALSILGPVAAMCFPIAIVLARDERAGAALVRLCVLISFAVSAILLAVLLVFHGWVVAMPNLELLGPYLFLLPVAVLTSGLMQTAVQWATWREEFRGLARASAIHAIVTNGLRVGVGAALPNPGVLIAISALAPALLAAMIACRIAGGSRGLALVGSDILSRTALAELRAAVREFRSFPLLRMPQNIVSALSLGMPLIYLARYSDPSALGHYTLAVQVLMLPSLLIGSAIVSVFYPRYARAARDGEQSSYLTKTTLGMCAIGILPYLIVFAYGTEIFGLVFGPTWRQSGEFASWLSLWLLFAFCSRPSFNAISVLGLERFLLVWELAGIFLVAVTLFIGFEAGTGPVTAIMLYSFVSAARNIVLIIWVHVVAYKALPVA